MSTEYQLHKLFSVDTCHEASQLLTLHSVFHHILTVKSVVVLSPALFAVTMLQNIQHLLVSVMEILVLSLYIMV